MAISNNILLDGLKGSIKGITVKKSKGQVVVSGKATIVANPNTPAQQTSRLRLTEVSRLCKVLSPFWALHYTPSVTKWTPRNQFTKEFLASVAAGDITPASAAAAVVAYTRGVLGMGNIRNNATPTYSSQTETVTLEVVWDTTIAGNDQATDSLYLLVVNLTTGSYEVTSVGVNRDDAGSGIDVEGVKAQQSYVFVPFFINTTTNKVATAYPAAKCVAGTASNLYGTSSGPFG